MGEMFWISWFRKSVEELKEIKENEWENLSKKEQEQLEKLIAKKTNEQK